MSPYERHVDTCLNCGTPTPRAYCPECGQEAIDATVTFRDQIGHVVEEVFTVEARLPRTLKLLFTHPGELTRAYNAGQRVRYMTPLKLYLFASIAYFLVLSFAPSSRNVQMVKQTVAGAMVITFASKPTPEQSVVTVADLDEFLENPKNAADLPAIFVPHVRALIESPRGFWGALLDLLSKASLVLVPIEALLLRLLYARAHRPFGEHVVFSLHTHAFWYAFEALTIAPTIAVAGLDAIFASVRLPVLLVYVAMAARVTYGGSIPRTAWKVLVLGIGYAVALALVGFAVFMTAFFTT